MGDGVRPNRAAAPWSKALAVLRISLWTVTLTLLWSAPWTLTSLGRQIQGVGDVGDGVWYAGLVTLTGMLGGCITGWCGYGQVVRAAEELRRDHEEPRDEKARAYRLLAERTAQLERERHEFFNELTVVSALLQMGAYERVEAYIKRILAMRRPGESGALERSGAGGRYRNPEGPTSRREGDYADPDLTGMVGLMVVVLTRAWRERVRFHVQMKVERTDLRETDSGLVHAFSVLVEQGLVRARTDASREPMLHVGFVRAPREDRIEVWTSGATGRQDAVGGWNLEFVRSWAAEMGGIVEVEAPHRGGSAVRVIVPADGVSA